MKNLILIIFIFFGFSAYAQDKVTVIHFNYKWNDRNNYNMRGLQNAKVQFAWLEDQPEHIVKSITSVPVIVILGKDGKVKMQYAADISFKIRVTKVDIDNDGKSDIKIDVKFLGLLIGGIISLTMTYSQLTAEIEIAKELPKQEKINIESLTQKIDFLEKQVERLEDQHDKRLEGLEEKVYKR